MNSCRVKLINILSHCEVSDPSYFTHNVHHPHIVSLLIKSINCYVDSLKWTLLSIEWFLALKNFNKLKFHAKCKVFLRSFFIKMKNSCSVFKMCSEVLKSDFLSFINIYNFLLQLFATSTTKKFFFYFLLTISLYFIIDTSVLLQSFFFSSRVVSKCKAIFKFFSCQGYENEKDLPHFQLKIISRVTLSEKSSSAYIKTIPLDNIWLRWQLIHLNVFCKVFQRFVKWAATTLWIRKVALNVIYISFAGTISLSRKGYFTSFFFHKKSIKLHSRKF